MNEKVWREAAELGIKPDFAGRAKLSGYELVFDGQSKLRPGATANIRPRTGSVVWGGLFRISEPHLVRLDAYEGVPENYVRGEISVQDDSSNMRSAWVYLRSDQQPGMPHASYLNDIVEGARACGLPNEYIHSLTHIQPLA